jgi:hypothetical protein
MNSAEMPQIRKNPRRKFMKSVTARESAGARHAGRVQAWRRQPANVANVSERNRVILASDLSMKTEKLCGKYPSYRPGSLDFWTAIR